MSEAIETGGPAYPLKSPTGFDEKGMSLRDHFAGIALLDGLAQMRAFPEDWRDLVAIESYRIADAMLRARATGKGE